jgi:hypothetical protein
MLSLRGDVDERPTARGGTASRRASTNAARPEAAANMLPLGMSFNFLNAPGVGAVAPPLPPTGRPMLTAQTKRDYDRPSDGYDRTWDGFDVYCGKFRFRRTSIMTLMMLVLALSCIGGAAVISLSVYRVADAIIETERIIDPAMTAAVPLVRHASAVMAEARLASVSVGALLNHSVAAADAAVPAIERAVSMLNATSLLMERMARLARHPTLRVQMDSD